MPIILLGLILEFVFFPFQFFADGDVRFRFITQLLNSYTIMPMKYSMIGPLFSLPLAFIDKFIGSNFLLLRYNFILFVTATFTMYKILGNIMHKRILQLFIVLLLFASMFPGHIIHYYGEVFSAVLMALGIVIIEQYKKPVLGWIMLLLSVGNLPVTIFPLILISIFKFFKEKNRTYALLPVLAGIELLIDAKLRMPKTTMGFSNYLFNDQGTTTILPFSGRPGFSYPMILGVLGELFSFGKGLLFFAPGLLFTLYVWKRIREKVMRRIFLVWLIYLAGLILVYSKWWAWYGGWFWGPRFLLFASIPASFNLAYILTDKSSDLKLRVTVLLVSLWSLWVGINGVVFGQAGLDICIRSNWALEHLCWYVPEFSVLFHPIVAGLPIHTFGWAAIIFGVGLWIYIAITTVGKR